MIYSSLEALEPRIAPASASLPYTDRDGDNVTIKITTKGGSSSELETALDAAAGFAIDVGVGLELRTLDLTNPIFEGANVSITAKRDVDADGDGLVAVGRIIAGAQSLGKVVVDGDLGRISGGEGAGTTAVKSLTVQSLGRYGNETQGGAGSLDSFFNGDVGKITVKEDVINAGIQIFSGALGSLTIGGSVVGGSDPGSGSIIISGKAGTVKIGRNLTSGTGDGSGAIRIGGDVTSLSIGGSVFGPSDVFEDGDGQIDVSGNVGKLLIKGNVIAGNGDFDINTTQVDITGNVVNLQVGGSLAGTVAEGTSGTGSGSISVGGSVTN
ncbi:MAG: hypothetical protein EOP84_28005, partial [Verrucomicrobiaceae bacterium]